MQHHSGTPRRAVRIAPQRMAGRRSAARGAAAPAMSSSIASGPLPGLALLDGRSFVHLASLAFVWLTIATSGLVFAEPAPTDALALGLIVLLPVVGMVAISDMLTGYLALWLVAGAAGLLAATMAPDVSAPATFTAVSIYLYVASFVLAAFVARNVDVHTRLIFNAWTVAAVSATAAGLAGYFDLLAGAYETFTRFGRVAGTFKDPNVFGPFLVAPFLYALHVAIDRPWRRIAMPLAIAGMLALGVFLSFSRGAWVNLAVALVAFGWLAYVTSATAERRARILQLIAAGALVVALVIIGALQNDRIVTLLSERASLTQSYDVGPEGRFGGQAKAVGLILENPLGIGATVFADVHHAEEVHNVYLSMMLNAGWLGGSLYLLMTVLTLALGLRHALRASRAQPLFLIAYAAFLANALEGFIIDLDHWRHVYLLMAIVWGMMSADGRSAVKSERRL